MPQWHTFLFFFLLAVVFHLQKFCIFNGFSFTLRWLWLVDFVFVTFSITSDKRNFIPHEIMMLFHMFSVWRLMKMGNMSVFFSSFSFLLETVVVVEIRYKLRQPTHSKFTTFNIRNSHLPDDGDALPFPWVSKFEYILNSCVDARGRCSSPL